MIDEQHKFGVQQRSKLLLDCMERSADSSGADVQHEHHEEQRPEGGADAKGFCDLLLLTATPIPRTQLMSHCGLLKLSRLEQRTKGASSREWITPLSAAPSGAASVNPSAALREDKVGGRNDEAATGKIREEESRYAEARVRTKVVDRANREELSEVYRELTRCVAEGGQAYWVCPFVEEGDAATRETETNGRSRILIRSTRGARGIKRGTDEAGCAAAAATFRDLQKQLPDIRRVARWLLLLF